VPASPDAAATPAQADPFTVDPRLERLWESRHRNDIEVFEFDPDASSFGIGHGRILDVELKARDGRPLNFVVGGETVVLSVQAEAVQQLSSPIIGFLVRDRLGQFLFGDNTYLSTKDSPQAMGTGERFDARFEFQMPILPVGDYTITVALAEGTQQDHVHHHWIHDALLFRSHSSSISHGLVGIPMRSVTLAAVSQATTRS